MPVGLLDACLHNLQICLNRFNCHLLLLSSLPSSSRGRQKHVQQRLLLPWTGCCCYAVASRRGCKEPGANSEAPKKDPAQVSIGFTRQDLIAISHFLALSFQLLLVVVLTKEKSFTFASSWVQPAWRTLPKLRDTSRSRRSRL